MKITLIIPCYNEEVNIQKGVLDKIGNYTHDHHMFCEVLIVDDGSTDNTKKLIKELYLPRFKQFRLVENKHQGKAIAVISGIQEATCEYVLFSDIDLATPLEEAEKLVERAQRGAPVIIGSRSTSRRNAPLARKIMAVGFIVIRNAILGLGEIRDTQCGFKMFRREEALRIIKRLQVFTPKRAASGASVSAGFDLEFLFIAKRLGYKISEVAVTWQHVETKNVRVFKDTFETLRDILRIKRYELLGRYK